MWGHDLGSERKNNLENLVIRGSTSEHENLDAFKDESKEKLKFGREEQVV